MNKVKFTMYEESKIWNRFIEKSDEIIQGKVKTILKTTMPLLKETKRIFPTYTNHDAEHSLKILELIEMILGDSIENLSASESAVILLSAYWHDLGMICNDIEEIKSEQWFDDFIKIQTNYDGNLTQKIVSEYIRTNHHFRLEKYLYDRDVILNDKELFIENNNIIEISFNVAMSHNYETKDLEQFQKYSSNGSDDDFVFCAILLRLADIMDFDNERTPNSSFNFLDLENPKNDSESFSQSEWKKHISSLGFDYKDNKLYFKAIPSEPETEHYIREFIKVIENELEKSKQVLRAYCYRWRDNFDLPLEIDISGINSIGYKFGDYKFSFDNKEVLDLLTGDNIYSNKLIFIRELLQNSIDASLYKDTLEKDNRNSSSKCKPINITDWYDKDGNYWIRFDDYGIGMDEYILLNYFTKIGKSFYESKDFNKDIDFKAISRFGIGILSCFMVANKVEVSTKKEGSEAIRFSIKSLYSYFVTQLENQHKSVAFFPSSDENEKQKYRKETGTSIALQIDFNKLNRWFEIEEELNKHIFYSPIEIQYQNKKIGTTLEDLDRNPWIGEEEIIKLNDIDCEKIHNFLDFGVNSANQIREIKLKLNPIKLASNDSKIIVQMLIVELIENYPSSQHFISSSDDYQIDIALSYNEYDNFFKLIISKIHFRDKFNYKDNTLEIKIDIFKINNLKKSKIGHNGIFLGSDFSNNFNEKIMNFSNDKKIYSISHIYLSNEFRPSLDISRSKEIEFDYQTISTVNLMLSKFITQNNLMNKTFDCSLVRNRFGGFLSYDEILNDKNLEEWKKEKIFLVDESSYKSFDEIKNQRILNYPRINHFNVDYIYKSHTRQMFVLILLVLFSDGHLDENGNYYVEEIHDKHKIISNEKYFQVGFFIKYHESIKDNLQLSHNYEYYALNIEHPFSVWLLVNTQILNNKYRGIFEDIKNQFLSRHYNGGSFQKLKELLLVLEKVNPSIIDKFIIQSIE